MKTKFRFNLCVLALVFVLSAALHAAITLQLDIENVQVSGGKFSWEIHFTPLSGWEETGNGESYLAEASYYFDYNNAALTNPVITYTNPLCGTSNYTSTAGLTGGKVYVSQQDKILGSQFTQGSKYHMYTVEMDIIGSGASSGLDWDHPNTGIENLNGDVADQGEITFVGSGDQSLPVDLSSFSARCEGQSIILEWVTESETENLGFILERSADGDVWATIASYQSNNDLKGQGNTSSKTEYAFTDINVEPGQTYQYRLSDVSTNGEITVYSFLSITLKALPEETGMEKAYPNPFNPSTFISYHLAEDSEVNISVYDMLGRKVQTLFIGQQYAGSYHVYWHGKSDNGNIVPTGTYLIRMQTENMAEVQKVLLMK